MRWASRGTNLTVEMIIRKETDSDIAAITDVTIAAFKTLAVSNHTEQFVINALRAAGALTISLAAEIGERVGDLPCPGVH
jgi:putative acetyltransferase